MLPSRTFMVISFIGMSMIKFELTFAHDLRYGWKFVVIYGCPVVDLVG